MQLTDSCYAITGLYCLTPWFVNAGFICGSEKTLVVDAGEMSISAQTIYGYAKAVAPHNSLLLINTEFHLDHFGGNCYFRKRGVPIYGHIRFDEKEGLDLDAIVAWINASVANEARRKANEGAIAFQETSVVIPENRFNEEFSFDLGGVEAKVLLTPGHTKSNVSVYQAREGVLFCGDAVMQDHIPNLEEGGVEDWQSWLTSLERIKRLPLQVLVPGHGNVIIGSVPIAQAIARTESILHEAICANKAPTF